LSPSRRAATLTAAYYAAIFAVAGAQLPYWPLWLAEWGLSEAEIGRFLGLAIVARIVSATCLSALADRYAVRRLTIACAALAAAALYLLHLGITSPAALLAATLAASVAMAPLMPLGEALGLRASGWHGFAYAPVRAAGSIAFLAVNVAAGAAIGWAGAAPILWIVAAGLLVTAVLGAFHPGGGAAASRDADRAGKGELRRLVAAPAFLAAALAVAGGQASHSVYYVYSVLDWRAQGIAAATIGWLWALGVVTETVLMLGPGRRWVARLGPAGALAIGALAGVVRWGAMVLAPPLALLWPLQALHALTFAMAHLGFMAFVAAAVPPRLAGSAQGAAIGAITGLAMAGAAFGGAAIADRFGTSAAYALSAALSAASLVAAMALGRLWRSGSLLGGPELRLR
jgi:MFS transporter, PPP family, 3-phenylpropionic acid transporter